MQKRVNITMNDELLAKIDEFSEENGLSRSAFLSLAALQYMKVLDVSPSLQVTLGNMLALQMVQQEKEAKPKSARDGKGWYR